MSERLSDVAARITSVRQLSAVITAMRGIAAARSREARSRLDGVRAYARTVGEAIGTALALQPDSAPAAPGPASGGGRAVVALCAEQGFVGSFNERVLEAAEGLAREPSGAPAALLVVGDRGLMAARELKREVGWSAPMAAHVGQAAALASRIVEELYRRLDADGLTRVLVVHAVPGGAGAQIARKVLIPFDFARFPPARRGVAPLTTLAPEVLLARLAEEYVFAELCEAVILSFAAENEARMRAMIAARTNVARTLDTLLARARQLRQEEITNEIVELAGATRSLPA